MMADSTNPLVSVIIPVLNGERTINDCLVSLLAMDYPAPLREILVVDNRSTDRTAQIVKAHPVRYVWEQQRGVATARNTGIEASHGKILAFIDADCVAGTGWLRELVQGFKNDPQIGAVVGDTVAYPPETQAQRYMAKRNPFWQMPHVRSPELPWFHVASTAFRRGVFSEIGLFDPLLVACEGVDFSRRFFKNKHFKVAYNPRAMIFHRHRLTAIDLFRQYQAYGRGMAALCHKYPEEISWGWRRELRAYADLLTSALALGRAAIGSKKALEPKEASYRYLDLVRKTGARVGFTYGLFRNEFKRG
ncbi:MAG: glycosyltransferase [Deltaproteobacteria bacterium]|nr:glycosyltransferase [Deltaproteobacteria bacterium]